MRNRTVSSLLAGALVVGTLDIVYAIAFWKIRAGTSPMRIFQSVAAGVLGPASARAGGIRTALLGAALHYGISLAIVVVYWLAAKRVRILMERPILCGAIYGLLVYGVMNYVVVPLSAAGRGGFLLVWVVCSVIAHMVLIGIPAAWFARRAST